MVIVVFLQVIFRFVLHSSLPWSEELSRYILVWISF
ncbi:TRAP transporter small permease subunit, partial [Aminobacterium sp. UBA5277]